MDASMHRCIYGKLYAPDYLKDSILSVSDIHDFLQEVLSQATFMYQAQTVNYLNNHFYRMVL